MAESGIMAGFEDFVREYGDRAYRCAYRLCGDTEEAKDLVQEAFTRVLGRWDRYDSSQPLDAWFFTILRHVFIDDRRRCGRTRVVSLETRSAAADPEEGATLLQTLADGEEAVLERIEREDSAAAVREALKALSREHREVLTLCDMEGCSYEEIAQVLGVAVGTVRSRVSRARDALRRRLMEASEVGAV